jgi:hypothetical protein
MLIYCVKEEKEKKVTPRPESLPVASSFYQRGMKPG